MPRWRSFLSYSCHTARHLGATLNWRRDPDYERRMNALAIRIQQTENEILRVESDNGRIENDNEQIENDILQVESEIVQIEKETEQLRRENAKQRALSALIRQHCFPDESNSTPLPPTEPDSGSS